MRRRGFIAGIGATAALPRTAVAQRALPVIGFLNSGSPGPQVDAYLAGLRQAGFTDGANVRIEYRWANGQYDRLTAMAHDLVRLDVKVLGAFGGVHTAIAAKQAAPHIPIVFANGSDPQRFGLVQSLNRPGGNATGISFFASELEAKRLELLHEMVPAAGPIFVLLNSKSANAANQRKEFEAAAVTLRRSIRLVEASHERDFQSGFVEARKAGAGGLVVASDPYYFSRREQLVALAASHAMPSMYEWRYFPLAGGLVSYGTSLGEAYRQAGIYTGRVLKGESPADLPVVRSTRFELVINLKTAKALGIEMPTALLVRADEVIE